MQNIVKNTTLINVFDLLAPHSCRGCGSIGTPLCNRCKNYIVSTSHNFCPICKTQNAHGKCQKCKNLPPIFTINLRTGLLDELIRELKYSSVRALALPLAEILHQTLPPIKGKVVIVPLPTISSHIRERGLDHTLLIAKKLAKFRKNWTVNKLLIRANNSVQVGSSRKDRITQAKKAYQINPKYSIKKDATYLLFDDIWTTGSSILSATKLLKKAGVKKIKIAILAVSLLDN